MSGVVIVVHGGAGRLPRRDFSNMDEAMRDGLRDALAAGYEVLAHGGSALDAVEQSVRRLEDNQVFNAGRGSVLNSRGEVRMDAAIMSGLDGRAGAVAALSNVVYPISAARKVMEDTDHVLLVGEYALAFCKEKGLRTEGESYFVTDFRRQQLDRARRRRQAAAGPDLDESSGTVGAVALDDRGNLASATSTGGMTNQLAGRVGDSPIVGAGTWADNETCAVSATGIGEILIRTSFAHNVDALIRYRGLGLAGACEEALASVLSLKGEAGCIAIDRHGQVAMPFSTPMMARGIMRAGSDMQVALTQGDRLSAT